MINVKYLLLLAVYYLYVKSNQPAILPGVSNSPVGNASDRKVLEAREVEGESESVHKVRARVTMAG